MIDKYFITKLHAVKGILDETITAYTLYNKMSKEDREKERETIYTDLLLLTTVLEDIKSETVKQSRKMKSEKEHEEKLSKIAEKVLDNLLEEFKNDQRIRDEIKRGKKRYE